MDQKTRRKEIRVDKNPRKIKEKAKIVSEMKTRSE